MIKQLLPISSYLVCLIILLLLYPNYNTSDKNSFQIIPFLFFWLTTISIIIFLFLSIFNFFKKRVFTGISYLISALSIYAIYKKLTFVDYNTFVHLVLIFVLLVLLIIYRNRKNQRILISVLLLINLMTILLSDQYVLSYFNSTKIVWSGSDLQWEHYKDSYANNRDLHYFLSNGTSVEAENVRAITTSSIKYKINTKGSIPSVVIGAFFVPNESFVKDEFKNAIQLNHEKGFVDICEYYARIIRQVFHNKTTGMVDYKKLFKKYDILYIDGILSDVELAEMFIERIIDLKRDMNEEYMLETEFGQNIENQKKWDSKIQKLLIELEYYK